MAAKEELTPEEYRKQLEQWFDQDYEAYGFVGQDRLKCNLFKLMANKRARSISFEGLSPHGKKIMIKVTQENHSLIRTLWKFVKKYYGEITPIQIDSEELEDNVEWIEIKVFVLSKILQNRRDKAQMRRVTGFFGPAWDASVADRVVAIKLIRIVREWTNTPDDIPEPDYDMLDRIADHFNLNEPDRARKTKNFVLVDFGDGQAGMYMALRAFAHVYMFEGSPEVIERALKLWDAIKILAPHFNKSIGNGHVLYRHALFCEDRATEIRQRVTYYFIQTLNRTELAKFAELFIPHVRFSSTFVISHPLFWWMGRPKPRAMHNCGVYKSPDYKRPVPREIVCQKVKDKAPWELGQGLRYFLYTTVKCIGVEWFKRLRNLKLLRRKCKQVYFRYKKVRRYYTKKMLKRVVNRQWETRRRRRIVASGQPGTSAVVDEGEGEFIIESPQSSIRLKNESTPEGNMDSDHDVEDLGDRQSARNDQEDLIGKLGSLSTSDVLKDLVPFNNSPSTSQIRPIFYSPDDGPEYPDIDYSVDSVGHLDLVIDKVDGPSSSSRASSLQNNEVSSSTLSEDASSSSSPSSSGRATGSARQSVITRNVQSRVMGANVEGEDARRNRRRRFENEVEEEADPATKARRIDYIINCVAHRSNYPQPAMPVQAPPAVEMERADPPKEEEDVEDEEIDVVGSYDVPIVIDDDEPTPNNENGAPGAARTGDSQEDNGLPIHLRRTIKVEVEDPGYVQAETNAPVERTSDPLTTANDGEYPIQRVFNPSVLANTNAQAREEVGESSAANATMPTVFPEIIRPIPTPRGTGPMLTSGSEGTMMGNIATNMFNAAQFCQQMNTGAPLTPPTPPTANELQQHVSMLCNGNIPSGVQSILDNVRECQASQKRADEQKALLFQAAHQEAMRQRAAQFFAQINTPASTPAPMSFSTPQMPLRNLMTPAPTGITITPVQLRNLTTPLPTINPTPLLDARNFATPAPVFNSNFVRNMATPLPTLNLTPQSLRQQDFMATPMPYVQMSSTPMPARPQTAFFPPAPMSFNWNSTDGEPAQKKKRETKKEKEAQKLRAKLLEQERIRAQQLHLIQQQKVQQQHQQLLGPLGTPLGPLAPPLNAMENLVRNFTPSTLPAASTAPPAAPLLQQLLTAQQMQVNRTITPVVPTMPAMQTMPTLPNLPDMPIVPTMPNLAAPLNPLLYQAILAAQTLPVTHQFAPVIVPQQDQAALLQGLNLSPELVEHLLKHIAVPKQ